MEMVRRRFLQCGIAAIATGAGSGFAWAQNYPTRSVRIITGFPAGGLSDILARLLGQRLSERLGHPFIIDNKPGAATNIATDAVMRSPADGYTLLLATAMNAINATAYDNLNFNFIDDAAPIASIVDAAFVLEVNPSLPVKTVSELIAYAKANPGKLNVASGGVASPEHVAAELFKIMTGVDMLHVPYRGSGPAVVAMLGGEVQVYFGPVAPSIEHIRAGRLRALAVTTTARSESLPGVPAMSEFLPGYAVSAWQGVVAPKNTPADIIGMLNREINDALADPKLKARFADLGTAVLPGSSADFARLIAEDTEKWARVIKAAGIKAS
jgi:tripartite-type tricarboxylate transporter receptor subunit TctC